MGRYAAGAFSTRPGLPGRGLQVLDRRLITSGEIEEMLIVMPDATTSYGFSFYTNSELMPYARIGETLRIFSNSLREE